MGLGSSVFIIFFGIVALALFVIIWSFLSYVFNNVYTTTTSIYPAGVFDPTLLITFTTIVLWFPVFVVFVILFYWFKNAQRNEY